MCHLMKLKSLAGYKIYEKAVSCGWDFASIN